MRHSASETSMIDHNGPPSPVTQAQVLTPYDYKSPHKSPLTKQQQMGISNGSGNINSSGVSGGSSGNNNNYSGIGSSSNYNNNSNASVRSSPSSRTSPQSRASPSARAGSRYEVDLLDPKERKIQELTVVIENLEDLLTMKGGEIAQVSREARDLRGQLVRVKDEESIDAIAVQKRFAELLQLLEERLNEVERLTEELSTTRTELHAAQITLTKKNVDLQGSSAENGRLNVRIAEAMASADNKTAELVAARKVMTCDLTKDTVMRNKH
jgi:hypothetical protein